MILLLVLLLVAFGSAVAEAVPVEIHFRVQVPAATPASDTVFLAGNFQGWDPASPAHALSRAEDGRHEITLEFEPGTRIEFKFTRGDWSRVEKGPNGEEIPNRVITVTDDQVLDLTVANWADLTDAGHTLTGDVTETTVPGFLEGRRVWVYLPPGYHESTRHYPLLVMLDGQNVFDAATSFAGEWEMDESCERLIGEGEIEPLIVVAVDNGGVARVHEYTPFVASGPTGGGGEAHLQAIVDTLLPWIRTQYRVRGGPEHTGFGGSSLGGLMAVYAAFAHAESFGCIAALSPSIWWADHALLDFVPQQDRAGGSRVWTDMGTRESGSLQDDDGNGIDDAIDDLRALREAMVTTGYALGEDLVSLEDEGARHNEEAWARRLPDVLRFLFVPDGGIEVERPSMGGFKQAW